MPCGRRPRVNIAPTATAAAALEYLRTTRLPSSLARLGLCTDSARFLPIGVPITNSTSLPMARGITNAARVLLISLIVGPLSPRETAYIHQRHALATERAFGRCVGLVEGVSQAVQRVALEGDIAAIPQ